MKIIIVRFSHFAAVEIFCERIKTNERRPGKRNSFNMDLNVAVSTASELFEDNDMVFPILMGRENLKILASPGSESSGVSSLDAEEAKVIIFRIWHIFEYKKNHYDEQFYGKKLNKLTSCYAFHKCYLL